MFFVLKKRSKQSGCSAARLAHLLWEQGVPGSNPGTPTTSVLYFLQQTAKRHCIYSASSHSLQKGTAIPNGRFHWYLGPDTSLFRYPDKELLKIGSLYSNRELEIMAMIYEGMETKEIGEKLFLSAYTISTHRKNILKKSGRATILEVIYELKTVGIL
jgi:DNA-binding NarL/FixJ family response regulator